ncbi:hypothetical protein BDV28DRAFT_99975 [Aspergillus coremiiformis]|uniref:RING-type domain-containing protein n=1 Tax=Aspergillus coremiiformis TaxID=138285 RepID=A0A5N6ZAC1_9EURO|nr:hypothetical protein BDV28DRAFT_99975 [Aspergillus coremiiformis]
MPEYYLCVPSRTDRGPLRHADLCLTGWPCMTYPQGCLDVGETCHLCYSTLRPDSRFRQLPCQHLFHQPCIDEWICTRDASCPLCRQTFYHLRTPYIMEHPVPSTPEVDVETDLREARQCFIRWWRDFFEFRWLRHDRAVTGRKLNHQRQHPR